LLPKFFVVEAAALADMRVQRSLGTSQASKNPKESIKKKKSGNPKTDATQKGGKKGLQRKGP
jgi:hypothetical protein